MHPNAKTAYYFNAHLEKIEVKKRFINPYTPVNRWVSEVGYYAFLTLPFKDDLFFLAYTEDFKEALLRKKRSGLSSLHGRFRRRIYASLSKSDRFYAK